MSTNTLTLKPKVYSTPALFKDYNKATNDLLTKNYSKAGEWKMESKFKTAPGTFSVKPLATTAGDVSAEVEYVGEGGYGIKVNLTPAGYQNLKTTLTYTLNGNKFDVVLHNKKNGLQYELSHQTCVALHKRASINEKVTQDAFELGMGVDVAPNCQVGCGAKYTFAGTNSKHCNWSLGCRYASRGYEMAIFSNQLKMYRTSASVPLRFNLGKTPCTVLLGFETECGKCIERGWKGTMGFDATCPVLPGNKILARVDRDLKWAATYVARMADNWTMAVTLDKNLKAGVLLTHS